MIFQEVWRPTTLNGYSIPADNGSTPLSYKVCSHLNGVNNKCYCKVFLLLFFTGRAKNTDSRLLFQWSAKCCCYCPRSVRDCLRCGSAEPEDEKEDVSDGEESNSGSANDVSISVKRTCCVTCHPRGSTHLPEVIESDPKATFSSQPCVDRSIYSVITADRKYS